MTDSFIFKKCGKGESKKILKILNPLLGPTEFEPDTTTIMSAPLPFYANHALIEIFDHTQFPVAKRYAVLNQESKETIVIDYANGTIEALNKDADINLNERNISDYLRFYFEMVIGSYGKFQIIEMIDDIPWVEDPTPQERKRIASQLRDVVLYKYDEQKNDFYLKASMLFKSALFDVEVKVSGNGDVDIIGQDIMQQDLQVQDISVNS